MLLSMKLKNQIKKELGRKGKNSENYEIILKNTLINGSKRGCWGFVKNNKSNVVVYIDTEKSVFAPFADKNLVRYAKNMKDYGGAHSFNQWAIDEELAEKVVKMLDIDYEKYINSFRK